jgi:hypothetical protein
MSDPLTHLVGPHLAKGGVKVRVGRVHLWIIPLLLPARDLRQQWTPEPAFVSYGRQNDRSMVRVQVLPCTTPAGCALPAFGNKSSLCKLCLANLPIQAKIARHD